MHRLICATRREEWVAEARFRGRTILLSEFFIGENDVA